MLVELEVSLALANGVLEIVLVLEKTTLGPWHISSVQLLRTELTSSTLTRGISLWSSEERCLEISHRLDFGFFAEVLEGLFLNCAYLTLKAFFLGP